MTSDKKSASKSKKQWNPIESKKTQKEIWSSNIINSDSEVSVFTKTINPKLIIESEKIKDKCSEQTNRSKHKLLKFLCLVIMCSIVLITFFLSLRTYNTVKELSEYFIS